MKDSRIIVLIIVVALIAGVAIYSYVIFENSTIQLAVSTPDNYSSPHQGYYTFSGIAGINVLGTCQPSTNLSSSMCGLTVRVDLGTNTGSVNSDLETKSITLQVLGSQFTQLAVISYQNSNVLNVQYSKDNSGDVSATVYTPVLLGGSTWNFDFLVFNPPTNSTGGANFNLLISAQLVNIGIIGHDYNLQASLQYPIVVK